MTLPARRQPHAGLKVEDPFFQNGNAFALEKFPLQTDIRLAQQQPSARAHHTMPRDSFSTRTSRHGAASRTRPSGQFHGGREAAVGHHPAARDFLDESVCNFPMHRIRFVIAIEKARLPPVQRARRPANLTAGRAPGNNEIMQQKSASNYLDAKYAAGKLAGKGNEMRRGHSNSELFRGTVTDSQGNCYETTRRWIRHLN